MRLLRSHYVLSLHSFIDTVRRVLLQQPKDLSSSSITQQALHVFRSVVSDVLLWVLQDDRIAVCVAVARLYSEFIGLPLPHDEIEFLSAPPPPPTRTGKTASWRRRVG
jgi:hypothetical protein